MIDCPYCLAQIPAHASMCQHCGQPVSLLLATQEKLAKAEKELADATAQLFALTGKGPVPATVPAKWSPLLAVVVFYVASIISTAANWSETAARYDVLLLAVMAALLGAVIANRDDEPNVWSTAMYALAQPAIAFVVIVLRTPKDYLVEHSGEMVRAAFILALLLAGSAAAAAVLYMLIRRRDALRTAWKLPSIEGATGSTERVVKLVSGVVSAVTVVSGFVAVLVNMLSPKG
jgi:hypothetical protein